MARRNEEKKREYGKVVEEIVSGLSGEKERTAALHLLSGEKALQIYEDLRENDIPYTTIKRIMTHSLNNIQKGRGITIGSYASGIAEELVSSERYGDVVKDMYEDGIIGERQYKDLQKSVGEHIKGRSRQLREGLSSLERKVAACIFGSAGIGLIIASGMKITGNIVGNQAANFSGSIAGAILFGISLVLFWRSFKN